jgi:hypothetical protein
MDINKIKTFYSNKKTKWAEQSSCYSSEKKWGEYYGYVLAESYTLAEVEKFEKDKNISLPEDLKIYLTQVSREVFASSYPHTVCLNFGDGDYSHIPLNMNSLDSYYNIDCCVHDIDCVEDKKCCIESCDKLHAYMCDGMIRIGNDGCAFNEYIIVNGIQKGTVWGMDGGDSAHRHYINFTDYIDKAM